MQRRQFLMTGVASAATPLFAGLVPIMASAQTYPTEKNQPAEKKEYQYYSRDEILTAGSDFLGVTVEALGGAMEKIFSDYGEHPTAYIAGTEASGAIGIGVRYGKGNLFMKDIAEPTQLFWQGPSIGFDTGANASRCFTLIYNLREPIFMYRRFPGVEGSAYFIGGLSLTYQRAEGIILAPIRAGVGFRLGANVGYMSFSKKRRVIPL